MNHSQKLTIGILIGLILGISLSWFFYSCSGNISVSDEKEYEALQDAKKIYEYIDEYYYKDVDKDELKDSMLLGLTNGLGDPYSLYMNSEVYDAWNQITEGDYCGVGLVVTMNDDEQIEVVSAYDGSPAKEAGIKAGDVILAIDGKKYDKLDDVAAAMRGEENSKVKITYIGKEKKTISLMRKKIDIASVVSSVKKGDIGYIKISQFIDGTAEEFDKALEKMEQKKVKGLVIDLRDNGGGLVNECLDVADRLLGECKMVCYIDNQGNKKYSRSDADKTSLPYVLLVNGGTASSSEIVTAAVKDNDGGKIVGTKTFGKGIIQSTIMMSKDTAVKLTVMEYRSPEGNVIHEKGIKPDYVVKKGSKDAQLDKAIWLLSR